MDGFQEVEKMKNAYGMLYVIETSLRSFIKESLMNRYGQQWEHIAPRAVLRRPTSKAFDEFNYYELVFYLSSFSLVAGKNRNRVITSLKGISEVRNKIAHCKNLDSNDWALLEEAYRSIESLS